MALDPSQSLLLLGEGQGEVDVKVYNPLLTSPIALGEELIVPSPSLGRGRVGLI